MYCSENFAIKRLQCSDCLPQQTHFMAGNTQFLNKLSGSTRRVPQSRNYRYPFSSLQMFEKPLSVKPFESLLQIPDIEVS